MFKKCAACHNADQGGANALGPNLWGVVGKPHRRPPWLCLFRALKGVRRHLGLGTRRSIWLANPKKFAPGTKMTFAGLGNPEDRANVIAFLNSHGVATCRCRPLRPKTRRRRPTRPAAEAAGAGAEKAENEPVLNEAQAAKGGDKLAGEAAPSH